MPWKLIPLVIKEPHWVGLTTWQLGREGFQRSGRALSPQGFPLIPDNACPRLSAADAKYFTRQSKNLFMFGVSTVIDFVSNNPSLLVASLDPCTYFFLHQSDLRCLLFLNRSLFNLHLMKQWTIFTWWRADVVIVSQWHCELPHLHCFQCLPLLLPLRLFPAPCCLVPLGLKNGHKKATTSKYWLGLRTADLSQCPAQTAWKAAIVPLVLSGP